MAIDAETFSLLKEATHRFVRDMLVPAEGTVDVKGEVPEHLRAEMREMGLFGLTIPEAYGGMGLSIEQEMQLVVEIGWTAPAFHTVFGGNNGIGGEGIVLHGTSSQRAEFLPRLAKGELIGAFALTEPDIGSDASGIMLKAIRDGQGWRLSGTKRFITNAPVADIFTVLARTGTPESRGAGITAFVVDAGCEGLALGKVERTMGHRGADISDVVFQDCFVPDERRLGAIGQGLKLGLQVLGRGRLRVAALCVGHAKRLLHDGLAYALSRKQFGQRIADFQLIQAKIADSHVEAYAAECMLMDACRSADRGENITLSSSASKLFASEMVGRTADAAVQIFGGSGYLLDHSPARFYNDVRLYRLYEGTSEIQRLLIARELIKRGP